ncbi:Gibberellin 2-beta-dioxygenase 8 [Ananas comosus]|uniref:Gibberellin 2-beta-dioxygenase 8 n=1 Tax=Ananas comosus TaxID=4615 RepID=A0A199VYZ9_ANACO|nr:Gibberellin 2-beta-dioxygenase 8 [Ananas comosus]
MASASPDPSYPPLFRGPNNHRVTPPTPRRGPTTAHEPSFELPVLELENLGPAQLAGACAEWGLFRAANHGVPAALAAELRRAAAALLALPFEAKDAAAPAYFWGSPAGPIRVKNLNWVEGFHVSLARCGDAAISGREFSLFRDLVNQYCKHMARIARTIFDAMAIDLKLTGDQSSSYLSEHDGTFRVYRYPRRPENCDNLGMEAHTDSSVLSILNEDDVGGLQILHRGKWLDVKPIADTLIVNLGDMMQAISSDRYKSVEHRVVASPFTERKSLCYFAFPVEDSVIISSKYKPFTYREFKAQVEEDIKATGAKVGLSRFRLSASN